VRVRVAYGAGRVDVALPDSVRVEVVEPRELAPPVRDAGASVAAALAAPLGTPPLESLVRGGRSVAVVVPDATRPAATPSWLPAVLDRLHAGGAGRPSVVVARGIHAAPDDAALSSLVGAPSRSRADVVASEPDDPGANATWCDDAALGEVRVHRAVERADVVLLCGAVAPHYLAGFSGGPKPLVPGTAQRETVERAHRLTLDATVAPDGSVRSLSGRLAGNAFHEALLRVARARPGRCLALSLVVSDAGTLEGAFAGEVGEAQEAAATAYAAAHGVARPPRADLVIAGGGAPQDSDLVQAHKALVAAAEVAKPGAPIVWFARAERGAGHPRFLPWFEAGALPRHLGRLRRDFHPYGLTAYALRWKASRHPVHVVSETSPDVLRAMGLLPFADGEAAVRHALRTHAVETCVVLPRQGGTCWLADEPAPTGPHSPR
jgi:nickel-dependent lactate racemase